MLNKIFSRIVTASLFLAAFTLTACFGGSTSEPTRYYTLAVENIGMPSAEPAGKVQIRKFTIDPAYQRTNIVYRESAYDFMFYDLDLWASRPEHMIMQVVNEYVAKSGIFESVELKGNSIPNLEISGNISAIEEVDEGDSQYAHLAVQLTFRKVGDEAPLWEKRYDDRESMSQRDAHSAAEAISKLYAKFMQDALASIANVK